jgi:hypothetical protein
MNTHRTDTVSLGFGVTFLAIVLWWLLAAQLGVVLPTAGWFVAGGLILFGVLGLMGSLRRKEVESADNPAALDGADPDPW